MSSKLEDALIFVRPMPSCVDRIVSLDDGRIACSCDDNHIYVFDSRTGDEISSYKYHRNSFAVSSDGMRILQLDGSKAGSKTDDEVKKWRYFIESIDLETGEKKEEYSMHKINGYCYEIFNHTPESFVVISETQDSARAHLFDDKTRLKWSSKRMLSRGGIRAAFSSQHAPLKIYVSTRGNDLYSISPQSGEIDWRMRLPNMAEAGDNKDRTLVIGSKHGSYARAFRLNKEGGRPEEIWTHDGIGQAMAVSIIDDIALVGTECFGGRLYGFDLLLGKERFRHEMTNHFGIWTMMYQDGTLYLGTGIGGKGRLYALDYKALGLSS